MNLRKLFFNVGVSVDNLAELKPVLRRFDSNLDGELTYSDVTDMFRPKNLAL